jgi:hypothetical protein
MPSDLVLGAAIAGGTSIATQLIQGRQSRQYFNFQHKLEERKKLRALISEYQGRVLEAANDWHRRMIQICDGQYNNIDPPDTMRLDPTEYYYQSVVFRFLQLMAIARRFEAEAFYIDARIAKAEDFDLLRFAKAFLWVMIHPEITPDDGQPGRDHFRSDSFRPLLDLCYADHRSLNGIDADSTQPNGADSTPLQDAADGSSHTAATAKNGVQLPESRSAKGDIIFDRQRCVAILNNGPQLGQDQEIDELLRFFDGVRPDDCDEDDRLRRRWDRLVALHLFVLAFIGKCGYTWQRQDLDVEAAVSMLLYPGDLAKVFDTWLPKLGLTKTMKRGWSPRWRRPRLGRRGIDIEKSLAKAAASTRDEEDADRWRRVRGPIGHDVKAAQAV